ncbi:glycosyltransferase family 9 protein [Candidatus Saccharibacteria bacterium]|nr:glycosyltransferase family 9 protein [Candidatus Saccharibacteria bacterium]
MGDILMTTPAFRALKDSFDEVKLTLLTSTRGALIVPFVPEIDDVLMFDASWISEEYRDNVAFMAQELYHKNFDGAIIFTTYSQSPLPAAVLCNLAGIPRVLAYCHENPYGLVSDWVPDVEPQELISHEVQRQLDLVRTIGATTDDVKISFEAGEEFGGSARRKLLAAGVDLDGKWLVLHAGASDPRRRYPLDEYAAAARELVWDGWQLVLTGSRDEKAYIGKLAAMIGRGAVDLSGKLAIGELGAVIGMTRLLVSNNTVTVHMAAAFGTPAVVLYAQTNPQHTPWQVPARVLYFSVPEELRSKNRWLQVWPGPDEPMATPKRIVQSVRALVEEAGHG